MYKYTHCVSVTVCFSSSVCNQSSGLEALGLADIRILVRLMCLAAGGRVHTCVDQQGMGRGSVSDRTGSAFLSFLSSAIGSLVSHSPAAYRELVDICTQVHSLSLSPPSQPSFLSPPLILSQLIILAMLFIILSFQLI